jgi:hypothetical protein
MSDSAIRWFRNEPFGQVAVPSRVNSYDRSHRIKVTDSLEREASKTTAETIEGPLRHLLG